jgi:alpha-glucosidase
MSPPDAAIMQYIPDVNRATSASIVLVASLFGLSTASAADYVVKSPRGGLTFIVTPDRRGALKYWVRSGGVPVLEGGALGLVTSQGDFTNGLKFVRQARAVVDETYRLPVGKRSTYVNRANELTLTFAKDGHEVGVVLRAYDDGIALRYVLPGRGEVEISGESTTFPLASRDVAYWGQPHPNDYGYESQLGPLTAERISMPVLAELRDAKHFVLIAQAGSYGDYVIPNYKRQTNVLALSFPMDQKEPVKTSLPFASPWRMVLVSPKTPARIVESTMVENLNPPTEPSLASADWIRPGRASWDFIAGQGNKLGTWIDFDAEMGWEWHVADAGWERRVPFMAAVTAYGKARDVAVMAWGKVANRDFLFDPEKAEAWMAKLEGLGVRGAKIDFFDQADNTAAKTDDLEDTQPRLRTRDMLSVTAARHHLMVEYHGCAIPSGERRRWPNVMSAEAVAGMERRTQNRTHDLTIPYVRNVMGPVSFTPIHLERSAGSRAYQLGQVVIYEAGIQIFAERYDRILAFEGVDFLKAVPSTWDDIRFIDGVPSSHAVLARRKGRAWFVGGMTDAPRTASVPLDFLEPGVTYEADVYRDGDSRTALVKEKKTVTRTDVLSLPMQQGGGFAVHVHLPVPPSPSPSPGRP